MDVTVAPESHFGLLGSQSNIALTGGVSRKGLCGASGSCIRVGGMSRNFEDFCDGLCNFGETPTMHYFTTDGTPVDVLKLDMRFFGVPPEFTRLVYWPGDKAKPIPCNCSPKKIKYWAKEFQMTEGKYGEIHSHCLWKEVMSEDEFQQRGFYLNASCPVHIPFNCAICR